MAANGNTFPLSGGCRADTRDLNKDEKNRKFSETFKPLMQTTEITPKSNKQTKTRHGADKVFLFWSSDLCEADRSNTTEPSDSLEPKVLTAASNGCETER